MYSVKNSNGRSSSLDFEPIEIASKERRTCISCHELAGTSKKPRLAPTQTDVDADDNDSLVYSDEAVNHISKSSSRMRSRVVLDDDDITTDNLSDGDEQ
jgi:hypothetical protein